MDMGEHRKGSLVETAGKRYVRVAYTDNLGKRRELMRRAQDKKRARELQKQLVRQLDSAEDRRAELDAQKLTFAKIAAAYVAARLIPAQCLRTRSCSLLEIFAPSDTHMEETTTAVVSSAESIRSKS